jgi:peptidoglycan biosynthesis protein MviN/MurJ (putative lipid II flippase)
MRLTIRKLFSLMVAAPLFVSLAWFFGIFLQPQGSVGAGFAATLIGLSAFAAMWVYSWIMHPGPKMQFRNRGVDGVDRDWGMGMMGASHRGGKRRREDDADDLGGRRSSSDLDDDADGSSDGSLA